MKEGIHQGQGQESNDNIMGARWQRDAYPLDPGRHFDRVLQSSPEYFFCQVGFLIFRCAENGKSGHAPHTVKLNISFRAIRKRRGSGLIYGCRARREHQARHDEADFEKKRKKRPPVGREGVHLSSIRFLKAIFEWMFSG